VTALGLTMAGVRRWVAYASDESGRNELYLESAAERT
jgi:hypothetical protein